MTGGNDQFLLPDPFVVEFIAVADEEGCFLAIQEDGIPVRVLARPGLGHSIDEAGLTAGGAFLAEAFAAASS